MGGDEEENNYFCPENGKKMEENPSVDSEEDKASTLTRENSVVSHERAKEPPQSKDKNPEEKLQGWLHHRARGIGNLKGTRLRWFVFGDENCKLYYYRDPQDLLPLGEVSISTASFYFDGGNTEKPGQFQIKSDGKDFILDARSRTNMMFWLQSLQNKRREYSLKRVKLSADRIGQWSAVRASTVGGLISKEIALSNDSLHVFDPGSAVPDKLPEIHIPVTESQDTNSGLVNSKPSPSWKLTNIKSALSSIKLPGNIFRENQQQECSTFYAELETGSENDHMSESTNSLSSVSDKTTENDSSFSSLSLVNGKQNCEPVSEINDSSSQLLNIDSKSDTSDSSFITPNPQLDKEASNRSTGSWTLVDAKEFSGESIPEEIHTGMSKGQGQSFQVQGQFSQGQGQTVRVVRNPVETEGKQGKLLSTFSNLKKMKFGKRQISMPGSLPTSQKSSGSTVYCTKCKMVVNIKSRKPVAVTTSVPASSIVGSASSKDVKDFEEELSANREIVSCLQTQLDVLARELESRKKLEKVDDDEKARMLVETDKQLCELNDCFTTMKQDYNVTAEKLRLTESELTAVREQVAVYEDMLTVKDEIIVKLTHEISDVERLSDGSLDQTDLTQSQSSRDSVLSFKSDKSLPPIDEREYEILKDMVQGYELQNKFLTKEILELNDLRKHDQAREKQVLMDVAKRQAKYYQIKSKYYVLLRQQKEKKSPVADSEEDQYVVNQLLQDALEADDDEDIELRFTGSGEEYDRYGFSRKHYLDDVEEELGDDDQLGNKAAEFERQSQEISTKVKDADQDASLRVKWENYMVGRSGKIVRCQELKTLIRQGIPHEYREEVWKGCINLHVGTIKEKMGPNYYSDLVNRKNLTSGPDPSIKQIELDLLRTLPNNKHYESIDSDGVVKLRKVLHAFSEYNKMIGYCQGLNRLAAIALLFLNEEDAFWCLVAIVDHVLPPEYFSKTLMAAQADQRVLKDLVQDKLPKVHQLLEANGVDLSLFTFNWFLTVFVDNIPTETFLRVWDTLLFEGSKVLFRFAIAFLKKSEEEILQQKDGLHLNKYLRRIGEKMTNVKQISWYAFNWINPFPMRFIANRRQQHLKDVEVELCELDKIRSNLRAARTQRSIEKDNFSDDEIDN